jgi:hypothetical protein
VIRHDAVERHDELLKPGVAHGGHRVVPVQSLAEGTPGTWEARPRSPPSGSTATTFNGRSGTLCQRATVSTSWLRRLSPSNSRSTRRPRWPSPCAGVGRRAPRLRGRPAVPGRRGSGGIEIHAERDQADTLRPADAWRSALRRACPRRHAASAPVSGAASPRGAAAAIVPRDARARSDTPQRRRGPCPRPAQPVASAPSAPAPPAPSAPRRPVRDRLGEHVQLLATPRVCQEDAARIRELAYCSSGRNSCPSGRNWCPSAPGISVQVAPEPVSK